MTGYTPKPKARRGMTPDPLEGVRMPQDARVGRGRGKRTPPALMSHEARQALIRAPIGQTRIIGAKSYSGVMVRGGAWWTTGMHVYVPWRDDEENRHG